MKFNVRTIATVGLLMVVGVFFAACATPFERGQRHLRNNNYDRAIREFTEEIRQNPNFAGSYSGRGRAFMGQGDWARAEADFTRAIGLNTMWRNRFTSSGFSTSFYDWNLSRDHSNRGVARYNQGNRTGAIADFEAVLRLDPNHSAARRELARLRQQQPAAPAVAARPATPAPVTAPAPRVITDEQRQVYLRTPNSAGDFTFVQNAQGGITITGYRGTRVIVVIPETINGLRVTNVQGGFTNRGLVSITFPNTVTSIGGAAGTGSSPSVGPIRSTWTRPGHYTRPLGSSPAPAPTGAFAGNLFTEIVIPDSVVSIGNNAFANNQLTSVTIPDSVRTIGERAFANNRLTNAIIPPGTSVGNNAFQGNANNFAITRVQTAEQRQREAEHIQRYLGIPNSADDFAIIQNAEGGITITGYRGTRTVVVIPETIHGIRVTNVQGGFTNRGLVSITFPNTVTSIGGRATHHTLDTVYSGARRGAFAGNYLTELVIPDSVVEIGDWAFFGNRRLTTVRLGRGLRRIGYSAFRNIGGLTTLSIPNGVTFIGRHAFGGVSYELVIPASLAVWEVGDWGFTGRGLSLDGVGFGGPTRVTLPANMHDNNLRSLPQNLRNFYISQGRRAGTYVLNGPVWTRQ